MAEYVVVNKEQLESDLTVVADAIREKGGTSELLAFPGGMADAILGIQSGEIDYARYANIIQFTDTSDLPKKVVLNLDTITSLSSLCSNTSVEELVINLKQPCGNMYRMIYPTKYNSLKKIVLNFDTSTVTDMRQAFNWIGTEGAEIVGELDFSGITTATNISSMFSYSIGLTEVRFKAETLRFSISFISCDKLSDASVQSIIDGLAYVETSQTITFHYAVRLKLTEEQKTQIASKNWILA